SSRRRHTRFSRDWSSDVCSSDLIDPSSAGPLADLTLPTLLETLKPVFDERDAEAEMLAFEQALAIARGFVEASIRQRAAKLRAETLVLGAIAKTGSGRVLELPVGMPFRPAIVKA